VSVSALAESLYLSFAVAKVETIFELPKHLQEKMRLFCCLLCCLNALSVENQRDIDFCFFQPLPDFFILFLLYLFFRAFFVALLSD